MVLGISIILTLIIAYIIGNRNLQNKFLNYLLLILLLFDVFYIGKFLVEKAPIFFASIIKYLQSMTSNLDAVILVALITGIISLLNSFYSRYSDTKNKRRDYLATKREEPYSEFIELVYKITQNSQNGSHYNKEDMIKDISSFNSKLTLWGSPKVVKKWNAFRENSLENNAQTKPEQNLILIEEVMNEMRKDLGVKSVAKGNLLSIFINDIGTVIRKNNST